MLTKREKQILHLVIKENTSAEIAKKLNISLRTVETHRKNILRKTGSRNIVGLVKYALTGNLFKQAHTIFISAAIFNASTLL